MVAKLFHRTGFISSSPLSHISRQDSKKIMTVMAEDVAIIYIVEYSDAIDVVRVYIRQRRAHP